MKQRVYTNRDTAVDRALETVGRVGLVSPDASAAERLRALALYADRRLTEEIELAERIAAYEELAQDQERSDAIRASVLAAAQGGVL